MKGKKDWLCSTPLCFENEKRHGWTALSPKLLDLRQGPGVKKGRSAITMLLVFAPHISLLQWSSALMCYFVVSDPVKSCDAGSKSGAFEKSSECIVNGSQAANGKCKSAFLLQITKAESRENSLSCPSSRSIPLDLSQTHSHFLNKTYPDTWVILSVERRKRHRSCVSSLLKLNNFPCSFFKIHNR